MIRQLLRLIRCAYLRPRVAGLERDIQIHDQAYAAWPMTREVWAREVSMLRQEIDRTCGSKHGKGYAVRSLMPKDKQ